MLSAMQHSNDNAEELREFKQQAFSGLHCRARIDREALDPGSDDQHRFLVTSSVAEISRFL